MTALSTFALAQNIDEPYDFPLKPGMPEWKTLKAGIEKVNVLQIPQDILTRMTTRSLLETCLNYPMFGDITAYSSPKAGMEILIDKYFNGFVELLKRKDIYTYLSEKFLLFDPFAIDEKWSDVEKGGYTFGLIKIELLLAQNIVLESTSYESKVSLLKEALLKYEKMLTSEYYALFDYEQLFLLMGKILLKSGNPDISLLVISNKEIYNFLEIGLLKNYNVINEIVTIVNRLI
jgi:hypothetical protein